jgi:hypothetical protein
VADEVAASGDDFDQVLAEAKQSMAERRRAARLFALLVAPGFEGDPVRAVARDGTAWQWRGGQWLQLDELPAEESSPLPSAGPKK